jgi:hypothetical protein
VGIINGIGPNPLVQGYSDVYIINPNITLAPNQTLTIRGYETEPYGFELEAPNDYQVDLTVHVWEYPGMPGSPL